MVAQAHRYSSPRFTASTAPGTGLSQQSTGVGGTSSGGPEQQWAWLIPIAVTVAKELASASTAPGASGMGQAGAANFLNR